MLTDSALGNVSIEDIERAVAAGAGVVRETPVLSSNTLTRRAGAVVAFKAENLQRTGSFKLRGALAKIASLGDACERGVVCASAGNHAQAVAYAARARNVPCEVFMPEAAAIAKVEAAAALGATVNLAGSAVEESLEHARARAAKGGLAFVHPFDDPEVIAGQGGIGLELLAQVPDLERVIVPVGGGGLISGVATALKGRRPEINVIGFAARPGASAGVTIADGIAVKRPGELTGAMIERLVDELLVVDEDDIAEAMVFMLERAKLVVEGAGVVGVAALLSGGFACRAGDDGGDPVGRQRRRRAAGGSGATARERSRATARPAGATARPARLSGAAALAGGGRRRQPARRPAHP